MSEHEVAFHVDSKAVVCSCGEYFAAEMSVGGMTFVGGDPLRAWAGHLRETNDLNLQDAYEAGWRDACDDWLEQTGTATKRGDPSHPIGARKRTHYPHPSDHHREDRP